MLRFQHWPALAAAAAALLACSDGTGPGDEQVGSVTLTAPQQEIAIGATVQLAAVVHGASGGVLRGRPVSWSSSNPEVAIVSGAGAVQALSSGPVDITAASGGHSATVHLVVLPGPCPDHPVAPIALGQERTGTLDLGSCTEAGGMLRLVGFRLVLAAHSRVRVSLTSAQFPPLLVVRGTVFTGSAWAPAGGTATMTVDMGPGAWDIWAGNDLGATGGYRLTVEPVQVVPCVPAGTITVGQTVNGSVPVAGCTPPLDVGSAAELWRIVLPAPARVRLNVTSSAFPATLTLTDVAGLAFAGGTNVVTDLPAGETRIWVTSLQPGGSGAYQLSVSEAPPECAAQQAQPLALGAWQDGAIADPSCVLYGIPAQGWAFTVAARTRIEARASTTAFPAALVITGQGPAALTHGTANLDGLTRAGLTLEPGSYVAWVLAMSGRTGAYQVRVDETPRCSSGTIAPGTVVNGVLATTDCMGDVRGDSYADAWRLELAAATPVRIDLTSTAYDTYLVITDALGAVIAADDDSGDAYNSRITRTLAAGTYDVWATTYAEHQVGAYQLAVTATSAAPAPLAASRWIEPAAPGFVRPPKR